MASPLQNSEYSDSTVCNSVQFCSTELRSAASHMKCSDGFRLEHSGPDMPECGLVNSFVW